MRFGVHIREPMVGANRYYPKFYAELAPEPLLRK